MIKIKSNNNLYNNSLEESNILKIATHNIRGMKNNELKQQQIINEIKEDKLHVIELTETNINKQLGKYIFKYESNYNAYYNKEMKQEQGTGVVLIFHKELTKHIQKVISVEDRIIYADLYFKGRNKIRIINIYMNASTNEKQKRENTIKEIIKIIKEGLNEKFKIIIMGDFNSDAEKIQERINTGSQIKWQDKLIKYLLDS